MGSGNGSRDVVASPLNNYRNRMGAVWVLKNAAFFAVASPAHGDRRFPPWPPRCALWPQGVPAWCIALALLAGGRTGQLGAAGGGAADGPTPW
jgi:hypothetical protein